MKKWIFGLLSFSLVYTVVANSSLQDELNIVNEEIQSLKSSLNNNQTTEMKKEVEGQRFMIADWDAYAKDLEQVHKLEEQDEQIRQQIRKLEDRKVDLIQKQSQLNKFSK